MPKQILLVVMLLGFLTASARDLPDTLKENSLLYQGVEYVNQTNGISGDPFFPVNQNSGKVFYNDNWYTDLDLIYDCRDDAVIVRDYQGILNLQLIKEKLQEFYIDGHHFIKLNLVNTQGMFYELIFNGKRMLLVQWHKAVVRDNSQPNDFYALHKSLFVLQDGHLTTLERPSDLFMLDKAHQRELKKFYRASGYSFKKDAIRASHAVISQMEANGW